MLKKFLNSGLSWLWISVLLIGCDYFIKSYMVNQLAYLHPVKLLPFLNFTLAYNTGAAFSFLHTASGWQNLFLGSLAVFISVVILIWLFNISRKERWVSISLSLIVSGAIGNAIDRVVYGHVIDFLDFHISEWHFAIFNLADSAICVGSFLLIAHWALYPKQ